MVFCGKQTLDGDTGQVGPGIACRLDLEQLTYVEKVVRSDPEKRRITVHRHLEDGVEVVETRIAGADHGAPGNEQGSTGQPAGNDPGGPL